jgi:transcriptional regulator with XRE-family HTH domain
MKIYDFNGKKNICGERVKAARKKLNLSQEDLAAKLQIEGVIIERDSVSRIEIGSRFVADYEILILSKILKVTPEYLLNME